jgi:hypothetical protein
VKIELSVVRGLVMINMCIKKLRCRSNLGLLEQRGWNLRVKEHEISVLYEGYTSHPQIKSNGRWRIVSVSKVNKGHEISGEKRGTANQGQIDGCGGSGTIKMWMLPPIKTNIGYYSSYFFVLISHNN